MNKVKTVQQYINAAPKETKVKLKQMRTAIRSVAPKIKEEIKWGMPAFTYKRIVVLFAGFKKHVSLFPSPSAIKKFQKDLKKFKTSRGTIQFPLDQPLPIALIKKITKFRVKEELNQGAK
ncbi:MAG: iron chaperone [Bacteriovoracia bacterium]